MSSPSQSTRTTKPIHDMCLLRLPIPLPLQVPLPLPTTTTTAVTIAKKLALTNQTCGSDVWTTGQDGTDATILPAKTRGRIHQQLLQIVKIILVSERLVPVKTWQFETIGEHNLKPPAFQGPRHSQNTATHTKHKSRDL